MAAYGATLLRLILGIVYIMHAYLAAVWRRTRPLRLLWWATARGLRLPEEDLPEVGLGGRVRVVGVDGDRDRSHVLARRFPEDLLVVVEHVAALGEPLAQVGGPGAHDDVGHEPGLLALEDRSDRRGGVPDV